MLDFTNPKQEEINNMLSLHNFFVIFLRQTTRNRRNCNLYNILEKKTNFLNKKTIVYFVENQNISKYIFSVSIFGYVEMLPSSLLIILSSEVAFTSNKFLIIKYLMINTPQKLKP